MKLYKVVLVRNLLVGGASMDEATAMANQRKFPIEDIQEIIEVAVPNDLNGLQDSDYVESADQNVNLTVADCKKLLAQATDPEFAEFQRLTAKFLNTSLEVDPVLFVSRLTALKNG